MKKDEELKQFDPSMFELVNTDINAKIHDQKLETKPTTFAKDALKRFVKNKSSVVGAVIIGILLAGSFLSFLSPYDIRNPHADESLLPAKIFDSGTGFWDGTIEYKNIPYDAETDGPAGFEKEFCHSVHVSNEKFIDQYYAYAHGGLMKVVSKATPTSFYLRSHTGFSIDATENFNLNIEFDNTDGLGGEYLAEKYKIDIVLGTSQYDESYPVKGWSSDFSSVNINLSQYLATYSITSLDNCRVFITAMPKNDETKRSYFLIKSLTMTSDNPEKQALLDQINITDPNKTAGYNVDSLGQFPVGYWACNSANSGGGIQVYHASYRTVNFRYDEYAKKLGNMSNFIIGGSIMNEYIKKGYCEFTDFSDVSTFKVLDEKKCPIISVDEVLTSETESGVWQWNTTVCYYKYKGYSKMPSYIFGTDKMGHDLLTVALSSLKTSLLVAIIASAACLIIGLIWGSIYGYFGGNVDIIMERITDILGGVPWIVMMTLIILLLGNNIVTFAIALIMTGWIGTSSRTRTQFYRFKGREYVLASRTLGASDARLIFRHILPNGSGTIVTGSVLMIPGCIFSEASISYLGLGLQGVDSFGVLLSENQIYLSTRPLLVLIPAIIISLLMISFNLFGNGLRDALNPTLKGGEQ